MVKVSILSFPRYYNYGTFLQLYALQNVLLRQGYRPELIDYDPYNDSGNKGSKTHRMVKQLKGTLTSLGRSAGRAQRSFTVNEARQKARFDQFLRDDLRLGPKTYFSAEQLQEDPPQADAYVVGSDQVWNPGSHYRDPAYFLSFAEQRKRIAYAPSFGVAQLPPQTQDWFRDQLNSIPRLSVREQAGAKIIESLTGQAVPVVLDPVFLMDAPDWRRFADYSKCPDRRYMIVYLLESDTYMREVALALAEQRGLEPLLIPVNPVDQEGQGQQFRHLGGVGPREFVGLIDRADFVCTDSFHGTSFSTILNRSFLTFKRYDNPTQAANHSRLESLLQMLDLTDRITGVDKRPLRVDKAPEFDHANQQIWRLRWGSMSYLLDAISSAAWGQPLDNAAGL